MFNSLSDLAAYLVNSEQGFTQALSTSLSADIRTTNSQEGMSIQGMSVDRQGVSPSA